MISRHLHLADSVMKSSPRVVERGDRSALGLRAEDGKRAQPLRIT